MVDEVCHSPMEGNWEALRRGIMVDEKAWKGWSWKWS